MSCGNTLGRCVLFPLALFFYVVPVVYGGFACLSNPCVHGVCLDDLNTTYSCFCIDGYTGVQCQTNWDECWSSPCQNGGVCIDGIAAFNCSCPAGFVGKERAAKYQDDLVDAKILTVIVNSSKFSNLVICLIFLNK